jgi:hypothetical protein
MYAIQLTWKDENGEYHYVVTDKVICTAGADGEIHYTGKQLITGKAFDLLKTEVTMWEYLVDIGSNF